jgi:hypothetical protein
LIVEKRWFNLQRWRMNLLREGALSAGKFSPLKNEPLTLQYFLADDDALHEVLLRTSGSAGTLAFEESCFPLRPRGAWAYNSTER